MKKTALIVFIIMGLFSSCSKYEDGPALSLRSKTHRLCGAWTLEKMYENGIEKADAYNTRWEFKTNGESLRTITEPLSGMETTSTGTWAFTDDKTGITVVMIIPSIQLTITENWDILRLKEKELWLETTLYGSVYKYQLRQ